MSFWDPNEFLIDSYEGVYVSRTDQPIRIYLDWHLDWYVEISREDSDLCNHLWYANDRSFKNAHPYAVRKERRGGRQAAVTVYRLHQIVCARACLRPLDGRDRVPDHINGNTLDCQRGNLRWATRSENNRNTHSYRKQKKLNV